MAATTEAPENDRQRSVQEGDFKHGYTVTLNTSYTANTTKVLAIIISIALHSC
ncbi:hypothetical protein EXN66_Car012890 [Channa argus]|uniref:Uncharacterized protein n=1 Tax=Channa argus TaxID=215402 RepID=A0A6G1Q3K9_CHAAH|nr:hypothetical protein EXN66_Car012890 [Channa argus]